MISETFQDDVYIADFTDYENTPGTEPVDFKGVTASTTENGIIPSFVLKNPNKVSFEFVNNEKNTSIFKRESGEKVRNCECIIHANRNDNRKGWMIFLELKYCKQKNVYNNMLEGIGQLKATCNYIFKEKNLFDASRFKTYLVISMPRVEPIAPFADFYLDQDFYFTVKEETGALLKAKNRGEIRNSALVCFED